MSQNIIGVKIRRGRTLYKKHLFPHDYITLFKFVVVLKVYIPEVIV